MISKKIEELPSSFCSVPWLQIHTEPDGKIYPCCYYDISDPMGDWNKNRIVDIFHSDKWNSLRKDFIEGNKPVGCNRCWIEEKSGSRSMRMLFNKRYSEYPDSTNSERYDKLTDIITNANDDGSINNIKLGTIDIIFNNLCNLKCRTCGPNLSTAWQVDTLKLDKRRFYFKTNSVIPYMEEDLETLLDMVDPYTEIHFSGGEPMMQPEHYLFLQLLVKLKKTDIKIRYNTNLTTYRLKDINAFELLQNFRNVQIVGSIDAIGLEGEYIRKGFRWDQSLEWINVAKSYLPRADYAISSVYSLLNCLAAIDLHRFICDSSIFKIRDQYFGYYLNTLHNPIYLKTTILPGDLKAEVTSKITNHIEWLNKSHSNSVTDFSITHWENALAFMNSKDETVLLPSFYHNIEMIDNIRDEKFSNVFPYLHSKFQNYIKSNR